MFYTKFFITTLQNFRKKVLTNAIKKTILLVTGQKGGLITFNQSEYCYYSQFTLYTGW